MSQRYQSFQEFWPFYLNEHTNPKNKILHFIGTSLSIIMLITFISLQKFSWLWGVPLCGYFFAWLGHFVFQKNRPATFQYPLWSLMGDFKMFWLILTFKLKI